MKCKINSESIYNFFIKISRKMSFLIPFHSKNNRKMLFCLNFFPKYFNVHSTNSFIQSITTTYVKSTVGRCYNAYVFDAYKCQCFDSKFLVIMQKIMNQNIRIK